METSPRSFPVESSSSSSSCIPKPLIYQEKKNSASLTPSYVPKSIKPFNKVHKGSLGFIPPNTPPKTTHLTSSTSSYLPSKPLFYPLPTHASVSTTVFNSFQPQKSPLLAPTTVPSISTSLKDSEPPSSTCATSPSAYPSYEKCSSHSFPLDPPPLSLSTSSPSPPLPPPLPPSSLPSYIPSTQELYQKCQTKWVEQDQFFQTYQLAHEEVIQQLLDLTSKQAQSQKVMLALIQQVQTYITQLHQQDLRWNQLNTENLSLKDQLNDQMIRLQDLETKYQTLLLEWTNPSPFHRNFLHPVIEETPSWKDTEMKRSKHESRQMGLLIDLGEHLKNGVGQDQVEKHHESAQNEESISESILFTKENDHPLSLAMETLTIHPNGSSALGSSKPCHAQQEYVEVIPELEWNNVDPVEPIWVKRPRKFEKSMIPETPEWNYEEDTVSVKSNEQAHSVIAEVPSPTPLETNDVNPIGIQRQEEAISDGERPTNDPTWKEESIQMETLIQDKKSIKTTTIQFYYSSSKQRSKTVSGRLTLPIRPLEPPEAEEGELLEEDPDILSWKKAFESQV